MTPQQFEQVQELMLKARQLSAEQREAFLIDRCNGDAELLEEVRSLLAADIAPGQTLNSPILGDDFSLEAILENEEDAPPPNRIGRYHVLETLGEGGMGIVYKAEQRHPIRRIVAVKVIKLGYDSKEVIARFATERQALAKMDHPNIARVIDAGTTDHGRPYFVMEHVPGVPITQFCDTSHLSLRQRLELFLQVCDAISHAHTKATIHRDLKASNVLAYVQGQKPVVKVIDFGIAKALTSDNAAEFTSNTHGGQVLGTYESMSPEQAAGLLDIDTRTDVYSLGLLLYRLLTGVPPVDSEKLMKSGMDEARRTIRDEDALEPSTHLSTITGESLDAIASARQTSPTALIKSLRGDLDWIVMKCLEKDRDRRYPTVDALAMDIQRHLHHEPVVARPRTAAYRLRKLVQRNPLASLLAAALAAVLLLASIISIGLAVRATRAGREAVISQATAEHRAEELRRYLYVAQVNEAGQLVSVIGGISRARELLQPWQESQPDLRGWEWYYLDGVSHTELLTLTGHVGAVESVAWCDDGNRLASAGADGVLKVWDTSTGRAMLSIPNQSGIAREVAWSHDGSRIAAVYADGSACIYAAESGAPLLRIHAHQQGAMSLAWSPDGGRIATGGGDDLVVVWDARTGERMHAMSGHTHPVTALAWSPDGKQLASSGSGGGSTPEVTKVWNPDTAEEICTLTEDATSLVWSGDSSFLARGGANWQVRTFRISDKKMLFDQSHGGHVLSVALNPDGTQIASSGQSDWTIKIWSITDNKLAFALQGHLAQINSVAWNPSGRTLASASDDGTIKVWLAPTAGRDGLQPLMLTGHPVRGSPAGSNWVESVSWRPDQSLLASCGRDRMIKLWNPATGNEVCTLKGHTGWVNGVAFSPDGTLLASASVDNTVRIWDVEEQHEIRKLQGHTNEVRTVAWSPDGKRLASGGTDKTIRIWDPATGQPIQVINAHDSGVRRVEWSSDGTRLVSASHDHTAKIWDTQTWKEIRTIRGHTNLIEEARWSPDNQRIATASLDHTIRIWDANDGRQLMVLNGHIDWILGLAWSPDGSRLASAANDETVKIWDTTVGQLALTLPAGPDNDMADVAWSPDGKRLAASGRPGYLVIYDASRGYSRASSPNQLPTPDQ